MDWIEYILKEYGIFAGMTVYFVYETSKRERRLSDRLAQVEDYIKNTLEGLVREATTAIHELRNRDE